MSTDQDGPLGGPVPSARPSPDGFGDAEPAPSLDPRWSGVGARTVALTVNPNRVLGADPHDFAGLYIRHRSSFAAQARRFLHDPRDVDEVLQEGFLRLFLALPELPNEVQAMAYCRRTITNLCIDRYRADQRRPRLVDFDSVSLDAMVDDDPGDPVVQAEDAAVVRNALAMLSPLHRAALIKREVEEKTLPVIAAELDVPEEKVKHLLHRARRSLRRHLAATHVAPGVDVDATSTATLIARGLTSNGAKIGGTLVLLAAVLLGGVTDMRAVQLSGSWTPERLRTILTGEPAPPPASLGDAPVGRIPGEAAAPPPSGVVQPPVGAGGVLPPPVSGTGAGAPEGALAPATATVTIAPTPSATATMVAVPVPSSTGPAASPSSRASVSPTAPGPDRAAASPEPSPSASPPPESTPSVTPSAASAARSSQDPEPSEPSPSASRAPSETSPAAPGGLEGSSSRRPSRRGHQDPGQSRPVPPVVPPPTVTPDPDSLPPGFELSPPRDDMPSVEPADDEDADPVELAV